MACCLFSAKPWPELMLANWALMNKLNWNLNQNAMFFIQENAFEKAVYKTSSILFRPQTANGSMWHQRDIAVDPYHVSE